MDAYVVFQEGDAEKADHMQAENDDHYATDTSYPVAHIVEEIAEDGCRNTKKHKDNTKANYKSQAVRKGRETIFGPIFTPGRPAAQVTDIRRN